MRKYVKQIFNRDSSNRIFKNTLRGLLIKFHEIVRKFYNSPTGNLSLRLQLDIPPRAKCKPGNNKNIISGERDWKDEKRNIPATSKDVEARSNSTVKKRDHSKAIRGVCRRWLDGVARSQVNIYYPTIRAYIGTHSAP